MMTREELIRQLVDRDVAKLGMTKDEVQYGNRDLYRAACQEFGTWSVALEYARAAHVGD